MLPNLHENLNILRMERRLSVQDKKVVESFIDYYISCSLENDIKSKVLDVQWHKHLKRKCQKKGKCHYNFPRFPTWKTIISSKLPDNLSEEEKENKYKKAESIKQKVHNELRKFDDMKKEVFFEHAKSITITQFLQTLDLRENEYYEALSIDEYQVKIHLKRNLQEIYINNYNYEILAAWNANIDFSFCPSFYEIITYITTYISKDEQGMTKHLTDAYKQCLETGQKDVTKVLTQCFTTHRQMGLPEVFYRIMPSLHLSRSNIDCIFLKTGYPENRVLLLTRAQENQNTADLYDIPGRSGKYKKASDIHDKYLKRPKRIMNLTYCQFGSLYCQKNVKSNTKITFKNDCAGCSQFHTITKDGYTDILPQYIRLSTGEVLACRSEFPYVVRFHDSFQGN